MPLLAIEKQRKLLAHLHQQGSRFILRLSIKGVQHGAQALAIQLWDQTPAIGDRDTLIPSAARWRVPSLGPPT